MHARNFICGGSAALTRTREFTTVRDFSPCTGLSCCAFTGPLLARFFLVREEAMARESREVARQDQEQRSIAPFRPLAEIARWEREMDRMLANFLGGRMPLASQDISQRLGSREPAVDIYEDGDDIVVK